MGTLTRNNFGRLDQLFREVREYVSINQQELIVHKNDSGEIEVSGNFVVFGPDLPCDSFEIFVSVSENFPFAMPKLQETGGRIPRVTSRHIFTETGNCCVGVWEEWLIRSSEMSIAEYFSGPVNDYFLSQSYFEATGVWPFGERAHSICGVLEAYCAMLEIKLDPDLLHSYLVFLKRKNLKQNLLCPCGSKKRYRDCHAVELRKLRSLISPRIASQMHARINASSEKY